MSSASRKHPQAERVNAYAQAVIDGEIPAGQPVVKACKRHQRDLKEQKKRGIVWRPEMAEAALTFFEEVLYIDDDIPLKLMPFQAFIIGSIFGWYNAEGFRRFRTAYNEMGKGNGKTPLAAGIGLYGLVIDEETAPEVYSAATTLEQAKICWKDANRMVGQSPELVGLVRRRVGILEIEGRYAQFRALSAEHRGLDGKRPHIAIIDELHEHPNALVVDKIRAGTKNRRNALIFEITNSGYDRNSVCFQHREYSLKVLDDIIENDSWFAYVCALDEGDDWHNEAVWEKANPGLGRILPRSYLREQVAEADGMPTKENIVKRLNFCIWTEQENRAIPMDVWDMGSEPIDAELLKGRACYAGLDLAKVNDLSALALVFPPETPEEKWKALMWYWVPKDDIQTRAHRDRVPYDVWVRGGFISTTPGNTTDYTFVKADIIKLASQYQITELAIDRTFAGELIQWLQAEGVTVVPFGQGFLSMSPPMLELMRQLKAGEIQHGGNPVLRWNASNLAVATDPAGNMKPDKEKSRERIDGIAALAMALGRAMVRPVDSGGIGFAIAG